MKSLRLINSMLSLALLLPFSAGAVSVPTMDQALQFGKDHKLALGGTAAVGTVAGLGYAAYKTGAATTAKNKAVSFAKASQDVVVAHPYKTAAGVTALAGAAGATYMYRDQVAQGLKTAGTYVANGFTSAINTTPAQAFTATTTVAGQAKDAVVSGVSNGASAVAQSQTVQNAINTTPKEAFFGAVNVVKNNPKTTAAIVAGTAVAGYGLKKAYDWYTTPVVKAEVKAPVVKAEVKTPVAKPVVKPFNKKKSTSKKSAPKKLSKKSSKKSASKKAVKRSPKKVCKKKSTSSKKRGGCSNGRCSR